MEDQRDFHLTELGLSLFKRRNLHSRRGENGRFSF